MPKVVGTVLLLLNTTILTFLCRIWGIIIIIIIIVGLSNFSFDLSVTWPQGMVLDGLKGFQTKKSKFMTFDYKSADRYLVLPLDNIIIPPLCKIMLMKTHHPESRVLDHLPPCSPINAHLSVDTLFEEFPAAMFVFSLYYMYKWDLYRSIMMSPLQYSWPYHSHSATQMWILRYRSWGVQRNFFHFSKKNDPWRDSYNYLDVNNHPDTCSALRPSIVSPCAHARVNSFWFWKVFFFYILSSS